MAYFLQFFQIISLFFSHFRDFGVFLFCSWPMRSQKWWFSLQTIWGFWGRDSGCRDSRAEKRSSKRVFLESAFLLCPLKVFRRFKGKPQEGREARTLQKHPFGRPFLCTTPCPLLWHTLIGGAWEERIYNIWDFSDHFPIWAAADIDYQNSFQSRFSGVYLVFEVFQQRESKEMLTVSYLILQACISFLRCFRQKRRISAFVLFA